MYKLLFFIGEKLKETSKTNENALNNNSTDITNVTTIDKTSSKISTSEVINLSHGELTDTNICEGNLIIYFSFIY